MHVNDAIHVIENNGDWCILIISFFHIQIFTDFSEVSILYLDIKGLCDNFL